MTPKNHDIICFYHGNCVDGAAAAAVIKLKYPDAACYPMQHGEPIAVEVKGKKLFIVDFSFDEQTLRRLKKDAKEVYWYHHHKTVLPTYQSLQWGVIDLAESGATLTWKQEYPERPVPKILAYVKDKDIWEWKLPHSRAVNTALREREDIHDPGGASWKKFLEGLNDEEFRRLIDIGDAALSGQRLRIMNGARFGFEVDFHGRSSLAVNWSLESSEMGEYIYKDLGYEVAIIFFYTGKHWNFSLRSDRIDVSVLAAQHGGGGHAGAAGFRKESIDWLFSLKKKLITPQG
jgi:oligoribonuclease NrnB/cAMP/cGMP phosphodiesterase (DHH superfamily)